MNEFLDGLKESLGREGVVYLRLKVIPNAQRTELMELMADGETVKMRVAAVPEKGKANKEIEKFLGKFFGAQCQVMGGRTSSQKLVKIY